MSYFTYCPLDNSLSFLAKMSVYGQSHLYSIFLDGLILYSTYSHFIRLWQGVRYSDASYKNDEKWRENGEFFSCERINFHCQNHYKKNAFKVRFIGCIWRLSPSIATQFPLTIAKWVLFMRNDKKFFYWSSSALCVNFYHSNPHIHLKNCDGFF